MPAQSKETTPVVNVHAAIEAAKAKAAELSQSSNPVNAKHGDEVAKNWREYNKRIDRLEAVAERADAAIEAAQAGDDAHAAELIDGVFREVFRECDGDCQNCILRDDLFSDFHGKERVQTKAGSLCRFADAITRPRRNVSACANALREASTNAARAAEAEVKARDALADAEAGRVAADEDVEEAKRELSQARANLAELRMRYSK